MYELKIYSHSIGQNSYHFIFRTKYNLQFFRQDFIRRDCEKYLREVAQKHSIGIYTIKILPNHVHLFVELPPTMSISRAVKLLKGNSSRKFFQKYTIWKDKMLNHNNPARLWSRWRFSRSVGTVRAEVIEHYINSSDHNQVSTYRERQIALC